MTADPITLPIPDDVPRTLEQVSDALGAPFTINALRAAAERGDLVTYRVVGTALFTDRRYVQMWIEQCRRRSCVSSGEEGPGAKPRADAAPAGSSAPPDSRTAAVAAAEAVAGKLTGGRDPKTRPRPAGRGIRSIS